MADGEIWNRDKTLSFAMPKPKAQLRARDIRPRQSLGQNFLCDPQAAEAIVRLARITSQDTIVEIGAGTGALTVPAARTAKKVFAIETDGRLIDPLTEALRDNGLDNVEVIHRDFMTMDLDRLYAQAGRPLIVLGNLPYYISSQILVRLVEQRRLIERAVLMFQRELAERITAAPGGRDYGRLSAMLRYCAEVKPLMRVRSELFFPRPKVASAVIGIVFKDTASGPLPDEERLFEIIKIAFAQRRKTIKNALSSGLTQATPAVWEEILRRAGIAPEKRAEALDAADYVDICKYYMELAENRS